MDTDVYHKRKEHTQKENAGVGALSGGVMTKVPIFPGYRAEKAKRSGKSFCS
ncbi:MAG: hypothetical protein NC434_05225 [Ruminococcus sp.]|nr:hypothetical protein [Ruminococcus sp.]